jgi:hypothetical protein
MSKTGYFIYKTEIDLIRLARTPNSSLILHLLIEPGPGNRPFPLDGGR